MCDKTSGSGHVKSHVNAVKHHHLLKGSPSVQEIIHHGQGEDLPAQQGIGRLIMYWLGVASIHPATQESMAETGIRSSCT